MLVLVLPPLGVWLVFPFLLNVIVIVLPALLLWAKYVAFSLTSFAVFWFQLLVCVPLAVEYPITVNPFGAVIVGEVTLHVVAWLAPFLAAAISQLCVIVVSVLAVPFFGVWLVFPFLLNVIVTVLAAIDVWANHVAFSETFLAVLTVQ